MDVHRHRSSPQVIPIGGPLDEIPVTGIPRCDEKVQDGCASMHLGSARNELPIQIGARRVHAAGMLQRICGSGEESVGSRKIFQEWRDTEITGREADFLSK
jgi:hypothetical protein